MSACYCIAPPELSPSPQERQLGYGTWPDSADFQPFSVKEGGRQKMLAAEAQLVRDVALSSQPRRRAKVASQASRMARVLTMIGTAMPNASTASLKNRI